MAVEHDEVGTMVEFRERSKQCGTLAERKKSWNVGKREPTLGEPFEAEFCSPENIGCRK